MVDDGSRLKVQNTNLVNSIFTLFTELIGVDNKNPKYYIELIKSLHLNEFNVGSVSNLSYSVKRLIKGLGSPRLYSQCGCFASLSCFLQFQECSVEDILCALEKEQHSFFGISKAETVAQNSACLLACGSVIHSNVFALQSPEIKQTVLKKLIDAGKKKSYFSSVTYKFVTDAVNVVNEEEFKNVVWPICKSELLNIENEYKFDQLQLLITCIIKCPSKLEKWLQKNSSSINLILIKTIGFLGNTSTKNDHPTYEIISQFLSQNVKFLPEYWQCFINKKDSTIFSKDKSIILFFYLMKHLNDKKIVLLLLQPEFIKILMKVLSSKKKKVRDYSIKAKSALTLMLDLANSEAISQEIKFEIIKKLILFPANLKFDMKTGLKCVQSLIWSLNFDFVINFIEFLKNIITEKLKKIVNEKGDEDEWKIKEKELAFNLLVKIINHSAISNNHNVKIDLIKFIFEQAFFKNNLLVFNMSVQAKESFYKCMILQMPLKDLTTLLDELAIYVNDNIKKKNLEIEKDIIEIWKKHFIIVQKLMKKANNKLFISVHVLLVYMGLQLFVDKELAKSGIEELLACYDRLEEIHTKKKFNENLREDIKAKDDPHWTEVVTDLILSLLSKDNKLWRHVVSCIFPQVVIYATPTVLHQIIDALEVTEESEVLELAKSDEEEIKINLSESQKKVGPNAVKSPKSLENGTTENVSNDCLRLAIQNALNYSASLSDNESIDMDQMGSDDEKRLNDNLSEAFKLFKKGTQVKKKKLTKEKEALTHFKLRVLDLVEIYIRNKPSMGGCLDLIRILLDILELCVRDPRQRFLQNRVDSILKQLTNVRNFSDINNINEKIIKKSFKIIHNKKNVVTPVFIEISSRISDCIVFLVRCSQFLNSEKETPLLSKQCNLLLKTSFLSRDLQFSFNIFEKLLSMKWKGNITIIKTLFKLLTAQEVKIFKKMKIVELLKVFYKNENFHISIEDSIKQELNLVEKNFVENFISFLQDYEKNVEKTNQKTYILYFSNILTLIKVILNNKEKKKVMLQKNSSWKNLLSTMTLMNIIQSNKKTRVQLANIIHLYGLSTTRIVNKMNSNEKKLKRTLSQSQISRNEDIEPKQKKKKTINLNSENSCNRK